MDKNSIKKYAVWARRELISRVSQRAALYGITEEGFGDPAADRVRSRVLTPAEKQQRQALIARIQRKGYREVMEEVAYTWFNRFAALRFLEVNGYLPTHVRVFTDDAGAFHPQILTEAIDLELDGLDREKVYQLKSADKKEELYKLLLITQCNALSGILPGMFQRIADDTELLFPDNLLREGSVIQQMIELIPEEDWTDQVQIIGWLYQYYNSEKKDEVFAALKKNVKVTRENIPAATQLFTPDWIVRYMVENSLGRLWVEGHPNDGLRSGWKYYLDEAGQEPAVQTQLAAVSKEYASITPEQIKCIDPCAGSGHILSYMFDVLVQIYEAYGYTVREAVRSILENNIYGLDIDDRAAQLSYFAVMMKARQYDRRFLTRKDEDGNPDVPQPHVYAIVESNHVDQDAVAYFCNGDAKLKKVMETIIVELYDAKEYGSILTVTQQDWSALYARFDEIAGDISMNKATALTLKPLVQVAEALAQKYDVVATNPPYMGTSNASAKVQEYVKKEYPEGKSDLFAVFIERCGQMTAKNRYQAMVTQHAWMFLSSFEKLRGKLQRVDTINMAHLGPRAFEEIGGEVVQTTSFVLRKSHVPGYKGTYCRLIEPNTQQGKEEMFLARENRYTAAQDNFSKIPGSPVAYWVSNAVIDVFSGNQIGDHYDVKAGICTGENERYIFGWHEVDYTKTRMYSNDVYLYTPHNKGGEYRKWYGNRDNILKYNSQSLKQMENNAGFRHDGKEYYFREHIGWSKITSSKSSFRLFEPGFTFDSAGLGLFSDSANMFSTLALLNSKVCEYFIGFLNPTLNVTPIIVKKLPYIDVDVSAIVTDNMSLSRTDWDSFETSWDFQQHPLVEFRHSLSKAEIDPDWSKQSYYIKAAYQAWEYQCLLRFDALKSNEEELNRIFIDIYGLQDELTPEVEDKDVTVRKADLSRDIRSFISYAVGCMFGRYSLDEPGLAYAGGVWDAGKYKTFPADKDNIIPICDDDYFGDDIVGRFVQFIETVYGKETLAANLQFLADALGGRGQPKEVIRNYFLNDFFNDHCKIYQKRPIYWQFDSGKKNGFKCLIYMHRYREDTIARIRTDYVHEQQSRYRTAIADLENRIAAASTSERVKLNKQLKKLREQAAEVHVYEEKIHHLADRMISIDLDDGVKKNYDLFQDVLAKIK